MVPPMSPSAVPGRASSTDNDEQVKHESSIVDKKDKLWTPLFLRKEVLLSFVLLHVALVVVLAILFWYSQSHDGLSTARQRNYLLWTYGPTAVFTLIAACWGQVEYRSKQLAPWKTMSQHTEPAERSLLLDFVSPLNFVSLVHSLRTPGTYSVAVAVGGAVVSKVITILSTGLFILQNTAVENLSRDVVASTAFGGPNGSLFNPAGVDSRPLSRVYGINKYNLPYPPGTTAGYAYQNFNISSVPKSSTNLTALVSAFRADLGCELLSIQNISSSLDAGTVNINVTLASDSCPYVEYSTSMNRGHFELYGMAAEIQCDDDKERRLMATGSTEINSTQSSVPLGLVKSANIICSPSYGIYPATVVLGTNSSISQSPSIIADLDAQPSTFPGLTAMDLIDSMLYSYRPAPYWYMYDGASTMYLADYLAAALPNTSTEAVASNAALFAQAAEAFYKSFAVQIAGIYFTEQANQSVPGSITSLESRLFIRPLAFGLIMGFLVLMIVVSVFLMFNGTHGAVPSDPGSIGSLAAILAASPGLNMILQGTGAFGLSALRDKLSTVGYRTETSQEGFHKSFAIVQTDEPLNDGNSRKTYMSVPSDEDEKASSKVGWYRPFAVTVPAKIIIMAVPVAIIVVLETLYQVSDRKNGITDVVSDEYVHYAYTYVPTTVLVGIGLLFSSLDFSAKIFQPYSALSHGPASSEPSLNEDYLGKLGLHCLWRAVKHRQSAVASSSLGMVLTPLLTIAVSGLFFVAGVEQSYRVQLSQTTYFPSSGYNESGDTAMDDGYSMASLVLVDNSSEPLFTHDTLAFPQLDLSSSAVKSFGDSLDRGKISVRVPAFRAQTNCTILPQERILTDSSLLKRQLISGPPGVTDPSSGTSQGSNSSSPSASFEIEVDGTADGRCSWFVTSVLSNNDTYYGTWTSGIRNGTDPDCPPIYAIFAQIKNTTITDITAMTCAPYLESVETDTTFNAADFSLDLSTPPNPDDATATSIHTISLGGMGSELKAPDDLTANPDLDSFFVTLLYGADGIPPAELVGPANEDRLRTAINRLYGRILAQVLNAHRADVAAGGAPQLDAILIAPHRLRLMQSAISTRILEGLLAGVVLCAAVTCAALDTKHVLPKNPCSIAAVASLLAGARMLGRDVVPEGAEWLSRPEKRERGVYEGRWFRMGWWPGGRFGIDVESGEKRKEDRGQHASAT